MAGSWKRLDLDGGGLQAASLRLAPRLRTRRAAYALWLGFALGLHRWYLREPVGALAYCALSAACWFAWQAAVPAAAFALFDLWWIDRRVTALNKRERMQAWLRDAPGAPAGFGGRFGPGDP